MAMEGFSEIIAKFAKEFSLVINKAIRNLSPKLDKRISKKKFCKLLQSHGIQRNQINEIVKENTEPYTMKRFLSIVYVPKTGGRGK